MRKKRNLIVVAAAIALLSIAVAAYLLLEFFIIPSGIGPVGTGIPALTSQFGDIKTRPKSPTTPAASPQSNAADNAADLRTGIQLVAFGREPRRAALAQRAQQNQTLFTSCLNERDATATPTLAASVPTFTPSPTPTLLATVAPADASTVEPDFIVVRIVGKESEACYQVGEVFFEENNRYELAVGVTRAINGEIAIDRANLSNSRVGDVVIDISQFRSNASNRDGAIRREWLESNKYPLSRLSQAKIVGLPVRPHKEGEVLTFQIVGQLKIRTVEREVMFYTRAALKESVLVGTAWTDIKMTDFGFDPPNLLGGLRVNNEMRIVINFVAREPTDSQITSRVEPVQQATQAATQAATSASGTGTAPATVPSTADAARICKPTQSYGPGTGPTPNAPLRSSVGKGHVLTGTVRSSNDCAPIANAKIVFWQTGPDGEYDDAHRAAIITGPDGTYRFEGNFPTQYGPQPHVHMYISAPGYEDIETEFFPVESKPEATFDIVLVPLPVAATATATGAATGAPTAEASTAATNAAGAVKNAG
jgi:protocatechuate 3,4-dioxygenase beta subunit/polyisoprenoid-binding protein YceI